MISLPLTVACTSGAGDFLIVRTPRSGDEDVFLRVCLSAETSRTAGGHETGASFFLSRDDAVRLRKALKASIAQIDAQ